METARRLPLIPIVCLAILTSTHRVAGCGGWWDEEPPHSLAGDLDRLPAKTLGKILLETRETTSEIAPFPITNEEILDLVAKIGTQDNNLLAASIDKLVMRARADYSKYAGLLSVLYDVRDAITAAGPSDDERKKYAEWRVKQEAREETKDGPGNFAKSDPLRPHQLYLEGAARFARGDRKECRDWFDEIVKQYPNHPRAETARFLLARCDLWSARYSGAILQEEQQTELTAIADASFRHYLKLYPNGRYAADAHGWLGGLLWETDPAEALEHFIVQFEDKAHPECAKSAAHMIEKSLARVVADPERDNAAMIQVAARHPRIAQAAVYFVLNAPEINPYDGKFDEPAALKQWKIHVLPQLAEAVSLEKALYQDQWAPRFKAMLAQAASAAGWQKDALELTSATSAELTRSDDLLFARMVALQRAGKAKDAIDAGLLFLKTFNESPLRPAVPVRLAQAMVDEHRAGEAYLNLCLIEISDPDRWNGKNDTIYPPAEDEIDLAQSSVYPDTGGTDAAADLKKTILNLAPLDELEAVVGRPEWSQRAEDLAAFKTMLARRKASNEDFAGASKFTNDPEIQERMTKFEMLIEATRHGDPLTQAQAMIALGDAFEADWKGLSPDNPDEFDQGGSNLKLRENARALGFADPDQELENRTLMHHATRWWLRAARTAPGTDLSAKARFKVLEGIERTALSGEYEFTRAIESNLAQASREIYDVLRKESPDSKEARDAVYWNFAPCPKPEPVEGVPWWNVRWSIRGDGDPSREVDRASLLGGYRALPYDAFGEFEPLREADDPSNAVTKPLLEELNEVKLDAPGLAQQFSAAVVTENFKTSLAAAENAKQVKISNLFEDLMLFHQVPGLTDEASDEYIRLRLRADDYPEFRNWDNKPDPRPALQGIFQTARANPALASAWDFIDYVELYANEADRGPSRDIGPVYPSYKDVEKGCRAFLEKYPKSPRREACSLLMMRAIYRQLPERFLHAVKPDGSVDADVIVESDEGFRQARLEKAIATYQAEFPKMRYAAEVRNFQGIIAWRKFEYGPALDLTIAQLNDMTHADLRREAAVRLANIFADLRDPRYRHGVMEAVKSRPDARTKLKFYLAYALRHRDHPLRCLGDFIEDKLATGAQ